MHQGKLWVGLNMKTNPIKKALELRTTLVSGNKLLVADFSNTLQGKDTSKVVDLMPIVGTNFYPFRTKVNVKEIDPIASETYKVHFFDVSSKTDREIESFVRKQEFDFPLWFKNEDDFNMEEIQFYNLPFILQVAGCNFHDGSSSGGCWYCFVDDKSNDGKPGEGKVYLGIEETIDSMLSAKEKIREQYNDIGHKMDLRVLRTSGGEPTIALDWILNLWRAVGEKGFDFVGQLDSNLSTGKVVDNFERRRIFEKNTLEKLADYPIKVLTALKGSDEQNLQSNVQSETTLADQEYSLKRFVRAGFDIFPQMYNPNPDTLREYLEKMDKMVENISLRIHLGPLKAYSPTTQRLSLESEKSGEDSELFIKHQKKVWDDNYKRSCEIIDSYLREKYNLGYKEVTRADVRLKLRNVL